MKETENGFKKGIPELLGFKSYDENGKFTHFIQNKSAPMEQTAMQTKDEILEYAIKNIGDYGGEDHYSENQTSYAMDKWAEQQSIEFFKWYALKSVSLITYLLEIKPLVRSEELESKIEEFEGKPIADLYALFLKSKTE
jgi:hypothetical protein